MTRIVKIAGISQKGTSPYTMTCMACYEEWVPASTTEHGLEKSAKDHWARCPGEPAAPMMEMVGEKVADTITEERDDD